MGERDGARIDVAAVRAAADQFDAAGELVDRAARIRVGFDGATAGRAHAADGDTLRRARDGVAGDLAAWARAAAEIAASLRAAADRFADADRHAASGIG
jgi:hypothetical protein